MKQPIRTKIHHLQSGVCVFAAKNDEARQVFLNGKAGMIIPAGSDVNDFDKIMEALSSDARHQGATENIRRMTSAANYCIDKDVIELLKRNEVNATIDLLLAHGIARLPMSPMTLEFEIQPGYHDFLWLKELHLNPLVLQVGYGTLETATYKAMVISELMELNIPYLQQRANEFEKYIALTPETGGSLHELYPHGSQLEIALILGIRVALLMLNTLGIEKEHVEAPDKLNKARATKGKIAIKDHTIVHLGRIYRKDGTSQRYEASASGRSMPVHWRQAHVRHVPYGPMKVATGERPTRLTVIPACLVNYREGDEAPQVHKEVRV